MSMLITLMVPLLGTGLGAATVFLLRSELSDALRRVLLGFAAGIMIAASVWSLLIPAIDMAASWPLPAWIPASAGLLSGIGFLLLLDLLLPRLYCASGQSDPSSRPLSLTAMLILAVTIHNIPEGMAVGVAYAASASGSCVLSSSAALALSLGISIQNFPEGAVISLPLRAGGASRRCAFLLGVLSGAVEPAAGFITVLFVSRLSAVLPFLLSFAAGAMLYVVIVDLIPASQSSERSFLGTLSAAAGFTLMMILDVALG